MLLAVGSLELEPWLSAENPGLLKPGQLPSPCLSQHEPLPFTLTSPLHAHVISAAACSGQPDPLPPVSTSERVCMECGRSVVGDGQGWLFMGVQVGGRKGLGTAWMKCILKMQDEYRTSMA